MLEDLIKELISAVKENTKALQCINGSATSCDDEGEPASKTKSKGRGKAKGKTKSKASAKADVTVADVKAQAKEIAIATDDPAECMRQIRDLVTEFAVTQSGDASKSLDDFTDDELVLFKKELDNFEFTTEDDEEDENDDMDI